MGVFFVGGDGCGNGGWINQVCFTAENLKGEISSDSFFVFNRRELNKANQLAEIPNIKIAPQLILC